MQKTKDFEDKAKGYAKEKQKTEANKPEARKILPAGVRGIVRMAETDLDGTRKLRSALLKIRGVGQCLASALPRAVGLDMNALAGSLNDEQTARLEAAVRDPASVGIPVSLLNRRADPTAGKGMHKVSTGLMIAHKFDIDAMKKMRCYRGIRHELGLPVRGQRTRSSFRTGMVAGVTRAKLIEAAKGAKAAPAPAAGKAAAAPTPGAPATPAAKPAAGAQAQPKKEEK